MIRLLRESFRFVRATFYGNEGRDHEATRANADLAYYDALQAAILSVLEGADEDAIVVAVADAIAETERLADPMTRCRGTSQRWYAGVWARNGWDDQKLLDDLELRPNDTQVAPILRVGRLCRSVRHNHPIFLAQWINLQLYPFLYNRPDPFTPERKVHEFSVLAADDAAMRLLQSCPGAGEAELVGSKSAMAFLHSVAELVDAEQEAEYLRADGRHEWIEGEVTPAFDTPGFRGHSFQSIRAARRQSKVPLSWVVPTVYLRVAEKLSAEEMYDLHHLDPGAPETAQIDEFVAALNQ